jgi:hypothetical protein
MAQSLIFNASYCGKNAGHEHLRKHTTDLCLGSDRCNRDDEQKAVGSFVGMLDGIREKLRAKRSVDKPMELLE